MVAAVRVFVAAGQAADRVCSAHCAYILFAVGSSVVNIAAKSVIVPRPFSSRNQISLCVLRRSRRLLGISSPLSTCWGHKAHICGHSPCIGRGSVTVRCRKDSERMDCLGFTSLTMLRRSLKRSISAPTLSPVSGHDSSVLVIFWCSL